MGWSDELASAAKRFENMVRVALAQIMVVTLTATSSALGDKDTVESSDEGADPGAPATEKKGSRPVARYQPFGFNGRPPKGLRGAAIRLGFGSSANLIWFGIAPQKAYGPTDVAEGDSAHYSAGGALVRCTGQDVVVNGGTAAVGRVGDPVQAATMMATWISAVTTAVNALAPGSVVAPTDFGKIQSGAPHFKG